MTDGTPMHAHAAPDRSFAAYAAAGFAQDLVPILPIDAAIDPSSPNYENLLANRGKVPGRKQGEKWTGLVDWTKLRPTSPDLKRWAKSGAGVGMQGRRFPCLDIDVDNPQLADAVEQLAKELLGEAPCRFGRHPRRALVYSGSGLAKRRLAFQPIADEEAPAADIGTIKRPKPQAVEFLGTGQQYVVEGIHPKTGKPYYWRDGRSPVDVGPAGLSPVTVTRLNDFYARLERLLELFGDKIVSRSTMRGGSDGSVAPSIGAIERALGALPNEVDYDTWIKLGHAVKASAGREHEAEGYALWEDWSLQWPENSPEQVREKWEGFGPKFRVGWHTLATYAQEQGDGTFLSVHEDFEAICGPPTPGEEQAAADANPLTVMFARYVWVERMKRACDLQSGDLLDKEQFNVRNSHIGPPYSPKDSAWGVLTANQTRLQTVKAVTYRPGGPQFVEENLPGLVGRCINRWKDPCPDLPATATDDDVRPWLDHCALVTPIESEREIILNWLAWTIQNPGEKPNWSLVIGSTVEGIGKDMMMEPVRVALGAANVREIGPDDLSSGYTDFLENTRLLLVGEMQLHERKAMNNRLKPLIAAPPYTLRVNIKFQPQFEIPNIIAAVFLTNMDNALGISRHDRRYFVTWNDGVPRDAGYYTALAAWFANGGAARAACWLQLRDLSAFNVKGRAPDSAAKQEMRKAARPHYEAVLEDGIEIGAGPFGNRLTTLGEVGHWLDDQVGQRSRPSRSALARLLKSIGARHLGRISLGEPPSGCIAWHRHDAKQSQVFALPGDDAAEGLIGDTAAIQRAYWEDRLSDGVHEADRIFGAES